MGKERDKKEKSYKYGHKLELLTNVIPTERPRFVECVLGSINSDERTLLICIFKGCPLFVPISSILSVMISRNYRYTMKISPLSPLEIDPLGKMISSWNRKFQEVKRGMITMQQWAAKVNLLIKIL